MVDLQRKRRRATWVTLPLGRLLDCARKNSSQRRRVTVQISPTVSPRNVTVPSVFSS